MDDLWNVIILFIVVALAIISIVDYIKSGDVSKLNPDVVEVLKNSNKESFYQREKARQQNRKRTGFWIGMLSTCLVPCVVLIFFAFLTRGIVDEKVMKGLLLMAAFIAIFVMAVIFLLIRENHKLANNENIYIVKAYLMSLKRGRNVRIATLAYYDYLQKKCVSVKPSLDGEDAHQVQSRANGFVEILVAEKKGKVKFIDLKR